jgi:Arc/MetJ-type ribon-helix-helix transcriptional regulator
MANKLDNLNPFQKGESGNPAGRPKGAKNRSTIVRELLELDENELKMHLAQIKKAIEKEDTNAYKAVLDSAYGAPKQTTDTNVSVSDFDVKDLFKIDSIKPKV